MRYKIITVIIFLFFNNLGAKDFPFSYKGKKYTLSIASVIRNEAKYLKEWIEFHRLIGVDHFYLYNNNSTDRLYRVLNPYIRKGIVTLIQWPDVLGPHEESDYEAHIWALSTQIPAYENAIKYAAVRETKWLALLNTDEYLVPVESAKMQKILEKYDAYPGIVFVTDVFDASKNNLAISNQLIIESRELTKPPEDSIYRHFTKLIVKPEECEGFFWPPYEPIFRDERLPIELKKGIIRINRYINRDKRYLDSIKHTLYVDPTQLTSSELSDLFDKGYLIEDKEQAIFRYLPDLKRRYNAGTP